MDTNDQPLGARIVRLGVVTVLGGFAATALGVEFPVFKVAMALILTGIAVAALEQ